MPDRPNVLFISSDQHQTAASGCYGHSEVQTPNIDRIAASGILFTRAYCQAPVCTPSRGSIITGQYPHVHGARLLIDPLPVGTRTIAHHFGEQGYQTAAIGKMHFNDKQKHGFQVRIDRPEFNETLTDEEKDEFWRDVIGYEGYETAHTGKASTLTERYFQDTFFADETVRYLRETRDPEKPFLLWSSYVLPHTPLVPVKEYFDLYDPEKLTLPERSANELEDGFTGNLIRSQERGWYTQTDEELGKAIAGYYGNITQMDACVGKVLDALDELGLSENTIIVYTTDHGEMAGAHRTWTKQNMYEQSVGVPLIVRLPDDSNANTSQDHLIEQIDLYPTLAELCELPKPENIQGRSFASLLRNEAYEPREYAYSEYHFVHRDFTRDDRYVGKPPMLMVRTDQWKLNYLSWERSELYDLWNDPKEFTNVIDEPANADIAKELTDIAKRMYAS